MIGWMKGEDGGGEDEEGVVEGGEVVRGRG